MKINITIEVKRDDPPPAPTTAPGQAASPAPSLPKPTTDFHDGRYV